MTIVRKFRDERGWKKYHTPKNLALSISIEAAELLEFFQWKNDEEINELVKDTDFLQEIKKELSDVFNYCLATANRLDIDLSSALIEKMVTAHFF